MSTLWQGLNLLHKFLKGLFYAPYGLPYSVFVFHKQTLEELKSGKPAEETRLGSKLKALGYKYFRDWYYPVGWMEGGYMLQAER